MECEISSVTLELRKNEPIAYHIIQSLKNKYRALIAKKYFKNEIDLSQIYMQQNKEKLIAIEKERSKLVETQNQPDYNQQHFQQKMNDLNNKHKNVTDTLKGIENNINNNTKYLNRITTIPKSFQTEI